MKQVAILGPTASGKSDLAIALAQKCNAYILSLDSLSIYSEIDIASAKPSKNELAQVRHFGVDICAVNEHFNVADYFDIYIDAKKQAEADGKNLIIVGGSGFYLKMLLDGLSKHVDITEQSHKKTYQMMEDLDKAYAFIEDEDLVYAQKISKNDRYRIEKWLLLFYEVGMPSSEYFKIHKPKKVIENIPIFDIDVSREQLASRIALRTEKMLSLGLVDEVCVLEACYGRKPNAMKSIGIKEVCDFLDGKYNLREMENAIVSNTRKLAKRQQVFNKTQFLDRRLLSRLNIHEEVEKILS